MTRGGRTVPLAPLKKLKKMENVTKTQIEEWKKKYGKVLSCTATNDEGGEETAYFRPVDRTTLSYAITLQKQNKDVEMVEHVVKECWIGGSEKFKTELPYIIGATQVVSELMQVKQVQIKNL